MRRRACLKPKVSQPPSRVRASSTDSDPPRIGRYRIIRPLGQGGFGLVYLAHDDDLDRPVAIKVPHPERVARPEDAEAYLPKPASSPASTTRTSCRSTMWAAPRTASASSSRSTSRAATWRPGSSRLGPSFRESAELVATVAEALHYAHTQGLVHRDIKPGNILLDTSGQAVRGRLRAGPEGGGLRQGARLRRDARLHESRAGPGRGHRVDGRSDIFSLGVVFYELLTGRRPFRADSRQELLEQITSIEARPPRQIDDTIPKELERICLKALSKRASERYTTARDMADDLRHFLQTAGGDGLACRPAVRSSAAARIDPGSRTAPAHLQTSDSDQRADQDRAEGAAVLRRSTMPTSSWNCCPALGTGTACPTASGSGRPGSRQTDADNTFPVGLIYGPSGCGKSSLVKAGLLPRLAKHVLAGLRRGDRRRRRKPGCSRACGRRVPTCPPSWAWSSRWRHCGRGGCCDPGQKVLLVLDQFEQWLHAKRGEENTELVQPCGSATASRSRPSSWCGTISGWRRPGSCGTWRFDLVEGQNIGRWSISSTSAMPGRCWRRSAGPSAPCRRTSATSPRTRTRSSIKPSPGLAQDGKVISVRLALFAEMVKGKPWTPATLQGSRRHGGRRRHLPRRDVQSPRPPRRSIGCTRRRPRRS